MRKLLLSVLLSALACPAGRPRAAEDAPRALVTRALEAVGLKKFDLPLALRSRHVLKEAADGPPMASWEIRGHSAGGPSRLELYEGDWGKPMFTVCFREGGGWMTAKGGGEVTDLKGEEADLFREAQHSERCVWLLPLLQDKNFTLKALGENKFDGKTVQGVQASYPRRNDVKLWFDKESGRLARAEAYWGKDVALTLTFGDYREVEWHAPDAKLLREVGVAADGPALLKCLREHIPDSARAEGLAKLVRRLGDDGFAARQEASQSLLEVGKPALPVLRKAMHSADPEVAQRARQIIEQLGGDTAGPQCQAVVRLIGLRKPAGAAEALLAYFPHAADAAERDEVQEALAAVAHRDGKPDPALLKALGGPRELQAVAAALGRDGGAFARRPGRRLYQPGLQVAHRIEYQLKEKKEEGGDKARFVLELVDLQFYNRHDDRLFDRPEPPAGEKEEKKGPAGASPSP